MALQKFNVLLINQTSAKSAGAVDELYRAHFIILTAPCTTVYCITILHRVPLCTVSQYCTVYHFVYHNIAPCTLCVASQYCTVYHSVLYHNIAPYHWMGSLHRIFEDQAVHRITGVYSKSLQCSVGCWGVGGVGCRVKKIDQQGAKILSPSFTPPPPPPPPAICIVNTANFYFGQVKS